MIDPKLLREVSAFIDAGGTVSWADWNAMSPQHCAAFVAVKRRQRVEQAVRNGVAAHGPLGALKVQAELDGGAHLETILLQKAVQDAAVR